MSLPLPDLDYRSTVTRCYTAEQMQAYGQSCREQALEKSEKDKARLDWLEQNLFNRENLDMFNKVCKTHFMWAMFAPRGVQGDARKIIDAAMAKEKP